MLKYWPQIRKSTFFKLGVVTAISYVLYLMAGFLLPLLLAVGLAFALYPLVNAIAQVRMAHGMIKLSRVVAIILALMAFCIFIFMIIGFIILPLFGQMNEFLQKLPALAVKSIFRIWTACLRTVYHSALAVRFQYAGQRSAELGDGLCRNGAA